jgi:hypothetical protein
MSLSPVVRENSDRRLGSGLSEFGRSRGLTRVHLDPDVQIDELVAHDVDPEVIVVTPLGLTFGNRF